MFIYYIAATPQSIVAIVQTGRFPANLSAWLEPKCIICSSNICISVKTSNAVYHQIFILKLEVPTQLLPNQKSAKDKSIILEQIDPEWIKQIFTYSQRGQKLLQNLLKGYQRILITIAPEIYPVTQVNAAPLPTGTEVSSSPQKRQWSICSSSALSPPPSQKKPRIGSKESTIELRRIGTKEEHLELLRTAFKEARKTILITSFAITHNTLQAANLYPLIVQAQHRGVKIYCYYNDTKSLEPSVHSIFTSLGVSHDETYTHSKMLAVDHTWFAVGSFNWLSGIDDRYADSINASIFCKGEVCQDLIEDLWEYLKHYRDLQFGRFRRAESFERHEDCTICYDIAKGETLSYITTLEQHLGFFQSIFEDAQERIVICSPFISSIASYKEDIDQRLLHQTTARGVEIFFICPTGNTFLPEFKAFLESVRSDKIHLLTINNFHLKTIVVDDNLIAEGSFNWLSASRDQDSDLHNHETTITIEGNLAKELIVNFYDSQIGRMILQRAYGDTLPITVSDAPKPF